MFQRMIRDSNNNQQSSHNLVRRKLLRAFQEPHQGQGTGVSQPTLPTRVEEVLQWFVNEEADNFKDIKKGRWISRHVENS